MFIKYKQQLIYLYNCTLYSFNLLKYFGGLREKEKMSWTEWEVSVSLV